MAACGQGQQPYQAEYGGGGVASGDTPAAACNALAAFYSSAYSDGSYITWDAGTSSCVGFWDDGSPMHEGMVTTTQVCDSNEQPPPSSTVHCTGTCTLILTAETFNNEKAADMSQLFGAFVAVLVVVWGVKQLLNLFTGDNNGGA